MKRKEIMLNLKDVKRIFSKIKKIMKKNAPIVVEVSNTFGKGHPMTPLAWDVGRELSKILYLERDIIFCAKNSMTTKMAQITVIV